MTRFLTSWPGIILVTLTVTACAAYTPIKRTVMTSGEAYLLQYEYEAARDTLLGLDLDTSERAIAVAAIEDLSLIKTQFDDVGLDLKSFQRLVEDDSVYARRVMREIAGSYMMAHLAYTNYLARTGHSADPQLLRFDESAREVYAAINDGVEGLHGAVDMADLRAYLGFVFRAIAAMRA